LYRRRRRKKTTKERKMNGREKMRLR